MSRQSAMAKPAESKSWWIERISPRGIVERIVAPWSMSGKVRSSTYFAAPVTLARPSLRGTFLPIAAMGEPARILRHTSEMAVRPTSRSIAQSGDDRIEARPGPDAGPVCHVYFFAGAFPASTGLRSNFPLLWMHRRRRRARLPRRHAPARPPEETEG